jgi:hypothetical protein
MCFYGRFTENNMPSSPTNSLIFSLNTSGEEVLVPDDGRAVRVVEQFDFHVTANHDLRMLLTFELFREAVWDKEMFTFEHLTADTRQSAIDEFLDGAHAVAETNSMVRTVGQAIDILFQYGFLQSDVQSMYLCSDDVYHQLDDNYSNTVQNSDQSVISDADTIHTFAGEPLDSTALDAATQQLIAIENRIRNINHQLYIITNTNNNTALDSKDAIGDGSYSSSEVSSGDGSGTNESLMSVVERTPSTQSPTTSTFKIPVLKRKRDALHSIVHDTDQVSSTDSPLWKQPSHHALQDQDSNIISSEVSSGDGSGTNESLMSVVERTPSTQSPTTSTFKIPVLPRKRDALHSIVHDTDQVSSSDSVSSGDGSGTNESLMSVVERAPSTQSPTTSTFKIPVLRRKRDALHSIVHDTDQVSFSDSPVLKQPSHYALQDQEENKLSSPTTSQLLRSFQRTIRDECHRKFDVHAKTLNNVKAQRVVSSNTRARSQATDSESEINVWFHIFHSDSHKMQIDCLYSNFDMIFEEQLFLFLKTHGQDYHHAIVEVSGDGTCLWNALLADLYLMKWFRRRDSVWRQKNGVLKPPITPLHLKKWTMFYLARNSHKMVPGLGGTSYLEYFRLGQGEDFMKTYPYNLTSLLHHLNGVMITAQGESEIAIANAVRVLRSPRKHDKTSVNEAHNVILQLKVKYKSVREEVFSTYYFMECRKGNSLRSHSNEVQTRAVLDLLGDGISVSAYFLATNNWMEFNEARPEKRDKQTNLFLFKNTNHYFSAVDINELDNDFSTISIEQDEIMTKRMNRIYNYPSIEVVDLTGKVVAGSIVYMIGEEARANRQKQDDDTYLFDVKVPPKVE